MKLSEQKCVPCEGGTPPLAAAEIKKLLLELSSRWSAEGNQLKAEFKLKDFKEAMRFVNEVAALAENEGHHPDFYVFYSRVRLELWTHAAGGLTQNDFILAVKIDKIAEAF